jgi:hypothetical protein
VKERRKDEERNEDEKEEKTHTRPFLFLFSEAVLGHDACVWSVVNTSHTHHTYTVGEGIIAEHSPSLYGALLPRDWYKSPGHTYP